MTSNSKQVVADLIAIEKEIDERSIRAHAIMASNKALLEGLLVRKWKRLWRIINCIEHRGIISCYGRVVPKNGRGRPPYRGYAIGRLSELEIVDEEEDENAATGN